MGSSDLLILVAVGGGALLLLSNPDILKNIGLPGASTTTDTSKDTSSTDTSGGADATATATAGAPAPAVGVAPYGATGINYLAPTPLLGGVYPLGYPSYYPGYPYGGLPGSYPGYPYPRPGPWRFPFTFPSFNWPWARPGPRFLGPPIHRGPILGHFSGPRRGW